MVHGYKAKSGLMYDPTEELYDWLETLGVNRADFEDSLTALGLMVVPYDDPTSFLSRRDEDD